MQGAAGKILRLSCVPERLEDMRQAPGGSTCSIETSDSLC